MELYDESFLHKHTRTKNNLIITNMSAALTSSTFVGAKVSVAKTTTVSKRAAFSVQANASGPKRVRIPISFFFLFFCTLKNLLASDGESAKKRKCQIAQKHICNRKKTIWKFPVSVFDATREFWGRSFDARSNARVSLEFNLA